MNLNLFDHLRLNQNPLRNNVLVNQNVENVHERIQDVMSSKASSEQLKENLKETEGKLKENQEKLTEKFGNYNEEYSNSPWFRKDEIYEARLDNPNFEDPDTSIAAVNRILTTPYDFEGISYTLGAPSEKRVNQAKALKELKALLEQQQALLKERTENENARRKHHGERLVLMSDRVTEIKEKRSDFEKKREYKALMSDYESVFNSVIGRDPEFKRFYERPNGTIDPFLERESRQLFFAMLSHETNDFDTDFALGNNFGEDAEANKKNYPFIHHDWLTRIKKVDTNEIKRRSTAIDIKESELKAKNIPEVGDIVTRANARITSNPDIAAKIGTFKNPLDGPGTPNTREPDPLFYQNLIDRLEEFNDEIDLSVRQLDSDQSTEKAIKKELREVHQAHLKERIALVKLQYRRENEKERIAGVEKEFTRSDLSKNRQHVMELAMRKFQKAMQIVDSPFDGHEDFHRNLNPAVRRAMIATVYRNGTSRYLTSGEYVESRAPEYQWMFSKLAQSKYFDRSNKERFLDPEQREFLQLAHIANTAMLSKQYIENELIAPWETGELKPKLDQLKIDLAQPVASRDQATKDSIKATIQEIGRYTRTTVDENNALTVFDELKKEAATWSSYREEAEALMLKPDRQKIRDFIEKTKTSTAPLMHGISNEELMKGHATFMETVDLNYNALDLKEKSTGNYLERVGINPEGVYQAYLMYRKDHEEMKVDQWDNHLLNKGGTDNLTEMFRAILPDSSIYKGKEDFLATFSTLHGFDLETNDETLGKDQAVALAIYKTLKLEMERREKMASLTIQGNQAALDKLRGKTFGDKVTEYGRGVFDMLVGPGRSLSERAAGAVILIAAFKLAQKAWKGDTKTGKFLQVALMAAAGEIALKKLTGEGLTDKIRLSGVAEALSGTYEDVLLDRAKDRFEQEKITETEHAATLMELRDVPFNKLMEWYDATDIDGNPLPGKERTKLPRQISIYNILPGKVGGNKKVRAQRIIKRTVENFFAYVGNKEDGDAGRGRDVLNEMWIQGIEKEKFDADSAEFARRGLPPQLIESLRSNPRSMTWQMVMQAEIRPADVEKVKGKKPLQQVADYLSGKAHDLERWSRNDIEQPVGATAIAFWGNVTESYVPKIQNFLVEMGEKGGRELTYYKNKAELTYNEHKITIRRVGAQHWELITEGVKLPFQVLYAADQFVVPLLNTKMRQMREIFRPDTLTFLDEPLSADDIMSPIVLSEMRSLKTVESPLAYLFMSEAKNPQGKYFGRYQASFHEAFGKMDKYTETEDKIGNQTDRIGYHIGETTIEDLQNSGIKTEGKSTEELLSELQIHAHKEAVEMFRKQHPELTREQVVKYMYPIHVYAQTAETGSRKPTRLYTFWRMPLPESREFMLKEAERWPDYMDPNKHKDRPPFIVDPEKGIAANLVKAFGLRSPALRRSFDYMTSILVAQSLRLYLGIADKLTDAAGGIAKVFDAKAVKKNPKKYQWLEELGEMEEPRKQQLDEWQGSAGNTGLALSDFYKKKKNADLYQGALDEAIKNPGEPKIDLESVTGWIGSRKNKEFPIELPIE